MRRTLPAWDWDSPGARYGIAILSVAVAVILQRLLEPVLGTRYPFAALFFAVLVTAWRGGTGPALVAAAWGGLAAALFLLEPRSDLAVPGSEVQFGMLLYLGVSSGIAFLGGRMRDAEKRAHLEVEARQHESENLSVTLRSIGDGVVITDAQGRVVSLNPVAETLTGWTSTAARGQPLQAVFQIVNELTRQPVENPVEKALRMGTVVGLANHTVLIARGGEERPIDDSAAPIRSASGVILGVVLVFRDISDKKRAELSLKDQQQRFEITLRSIGDAIVSADGNGRVTFLNRAAEELTGWKASEAIGQPLETVYDVAHEEAKRTIEFNPSDSGILKEPSRSTPKVPSTLTTLTSRDGSPRPVAETRSSITDDEGLVRGMVIAIRDISRQRRTERRRSARLAITQTISQAAAIGEAMPTVLRAVCEGLDWDIGALWLVDEDPSAIACVELWKKEDVSAEAFVQATRSGRFTDGGSLPGRVWKGGLPAWIADIETEDRFPRKAVAVECGMHGAFATPVYVGDRVLGVVEFFSREIREPDDDLLEMMSNMGGHLGQFIERRRAELATAASEERLRLALDAGRMGIWDWNVATNAVTWSDNLEELHGMPPGAFNGTLDAVHQMIHPADRERVEQAIRTALENRELYATEFRNVWPDGTIHWMSARGKGFYNEEGRPVRMLGVCVDVTERKRAEESLRHSEETFRRAIVDAPIPIIMHAEDGAVLALSKTWSRLTGYGPEEVSRFQDWVSQAFGEQAEEVKSSVQSLFTNNAHALEGEFALRTKSGERRVWNITASTPGRMPDGRKFLVGMATDVTDRKRSEQSARFLADVSANLAGLVDYQSTLERVARLAIPHFADWCVVHVVDDHGHLSPLAMAHANPDRQGWLEDLTRRFPPRPDQPHGPQHVVRTGKAELVTNLNDISLSAIAQNGEHEHLLREAGVLSMISVPLNVWRKTLGVLTFFTAESGRRYAAEELAVAEDLCHRAAIAVENARLYAELRDADRRKDEFLAMLAHELRNPLAPIRTGLELLGKDLGANETIDVMRDQVAHIVRMVDDLLDVSRIMRGKIELKKEPVDIGAALTRAIDSVRPFLTVQKHELIVHRPEQAAALEADPVRLTQVITNLLNNAAKYTEPGGRIEVSLEQEPLGVKLRVKDNGVGIEPDLLPHIFDLFTQGDRSIDRSQGGLGIGLTLVKSLVEMHGGSVSALSEGPGKGTEFIVRLPMLAERRAVQADHWRPAPTRKWRVLVVDDNVGSARILAKMLSQFWGHEVQTAHDGLSAIRETKAFRPELVLLDIGLPGLDGYEVARRLREDPVTKDLVLVALTGYGQEEDRRRSQAAGFNEHLVKPASVDALQSVFLRAEKLVEPSPPEESATGTKAAV